MDSQELKSRTMMLGMELLGRRFGIDAQVFVSWLAGRANPPSHVVKRLLVETANIDPFYYEVVDDPMSSPGGRQLHASLLHVSEQLERLHAWFTPVGVRFRRKQGVCLVNCLGEPISPWMADIRRLGLYLSGVRSPGTPLAPTG